MALDAIKALDLGRQAYQGSTNYFDSNIRRQIEEDIRQFQGVHASGSKYHADAYRSRSKFFRPKTRVMVRKHEAIAAEAFFSSLDAVGIKAINDGDPVAQGSAEIIKELLNYRLTTPGQGIPWFLTVLGAYQESMVAGAVASHQYWEWDPKRKIDRPAIDLLPPENLRFDPAAKWTDAIGTSPYVIRLVPMFLKDVTARMTQANPRTGQPRWKPVTREALLSATQRSMDTLRLTRERGRTDNLSQPTDITEFSIVWVHQVVMEWNGDDYIYWTLATENMLTDPVPLENAYWHGKRPFTLGFSAIETHKHYPAGPVRITHDAQAEINDVANLRLDTVKFVLNKRYFVKRGKQVDLMSLRRNIPGAATLMTDPEKDVKVVDFHDVTQSSYQEQDRLNADFDDVSGTFSQGSVATNRRLNETVGGLTLVKSDASQVAGYQLRTFVETWVEPTLAQIVLLEQEYETDERVIALCGRKVKLFERFGIDSVTDEMLREQMTLRVNVGMGATNPVDRINQLMTALNAIKTALEGGLLQQFGLKVEELIKEILGAIGYKDGERFFDMSEEDPRVAQLTQAVQQLQQALDAKHPPELLAATVDKMRAEIKQIMATALNTGVTAAYAAMQAGEVIASVPGVAPVADKIMQAAGYTVPSPPGVDPNYPTAQQAALPAPQGSPPALPAPVEGITPHQNTSPMFPPRSPAPASADQGAGHGIETQRPDGVSQISPMRAPAAPNGQSLQPRWFQAHEAQRQIDEQAKADKTAAEKKAEQEAAAQRKAQEDQKKAAEPKVEAVVAKAVTEALDRALAPIEKQLERLEQDIRDISTEPSEKSEPIINVHIDKAGKKKMEITAPSGETYQGSIAEDTEETPPQTPPPSRVRTLQIVAPSGETYTGTIRDGDRP